MTRIKRAVCALTVFCVMFVFMTAVHADEYTYTARGYMYGHTYYLYDEGLTWEEAAEYCESVGGHLVTIGDEYEQDLIESMISSGSKNAYWLGGYRDDDGEYVWITGEEMTYTNWDNGQPDDADNDTQTKMMMFKTPNGGSSVTGGWDNTANEGAAGLTGTSYKYGSLGFVCEWEYMIEEAEASATPEPTATSEPTATPEPTATAKPTPTPEATEGPTSTPKPTVGPDASGIVYFNGHSYRVFFTKTDPNTAEEYCESIGGYLTAITSQEEQDFIVELCKSAYETNSDFYDFYIGATDYGTEGEWRWMNGEEWDYTSWSTSSEPNNGLGRGEDYAVAGQVRGWDWLDVYGGYDNYSTYNGFICEWDEIITSFDSEVSEWSSTEMEEAYEANLIPENLVSEDLTERVSRSEFASIAVKLYEALSGESVSSVKTPFTDITGDKNYFEIGKAYGLNIAVGVSDTEFEPNTDINREQLATMLCRTIKKYKFAGWTYATDSEYFLDSEGAKKFEDDDEISDYAKPSVYYMSKMGIINGIDDTHFAPQNTTDEQEASGYATATREQAIALSLRIYKLSDLW